VAGVVTTALLKPILLFLIVLCCFLLIQMCYLLDVWLLIQSNPLNITLRDCLYCVILNRVDIEELLYWSECQYSTICSTSLYYWHRQLHDFHYTSTVHHTTSCCCVYYTAKADCEWPGIQCISTGRSSQGTVEIWEVGRMMWSPSPSQQLPAVLFILGRSSQGTVEIQEVYVVRMLWSRSLPLSAASCSFIAATLVGEARRSSWIINM